MWLLVLIQNSGTKKQNSMVFQQANQRVECHITREDTYMLTATHYQWIHFPLNNFVVAHMIYESPYIHTCNNIAAIIGNKQYKIHHAPILVSSFFFNNYGQQHVHLCYNKTFLKITVLSTSCIDLEQYNCFTPFKYGPILIETQYDFHVHFLFMIAFFLWDVSATETPARYFESAECDQEMYN